VRERQTTSPRNTDAGNFVSEGFTSDNLMERMTVARYVPLSDYYRGPHTFAHVRLLALSLQENEINVNIWERAKRLEAARKARME